MSVGTSNEVREWYEETREPDVIQTTELVWNLSPARRAGKQQAALYAIGNHIHASIQSFTNDLRTAAGKLDQAYKDAAKQRAQSDWTQWPPPSDKPREDETVKERALRLAKQPHPMAALKIFDHHGRRRY